MSQVFLRNISFSPSARTHPPSHVPELPCQAHQTPEEICAHTITPVPCTSMRSDCRIQLPMCVYLRVCHDSSDLFLSPAQVLVQPTAPRRIKTDPSRSAIRTLLPLLSPSPLLPCTRAVAGEKVTSLAEAEMRTTQRSTTFECTKSFHSATCGAKSF